jgi:hypothetical protein
MRTRKSQCAHCGHVLDAASAVSQIGRWPHNGQRRFNVNDDVDPKPGDMTVCIICGHVSVFADDLQLREPNDEEIVRIAGNPALLAIQWARGKVMKEHGGACRHGIPLVLCRQCSTATAAVIALPDRSRERIR